MEVVQLVGSENPFVLLKRYSSPQLVLTVAEKIKKLNITQKLNLMEICGGHTVAILKYGINQLLPENVRLISGPGCPVCVTEISFIDKAIEYAKSDDFIIATFGDLIRVPGSETSLEKINVINNNVKIVYSPFDAVRLAQENPQKNVIFLAIGFETTAPGVASTIIYAMKNQIKNFFIISAHKLTVPAMRVIVNTREINISGFICPGHVTTVIGADSYRFLAEEFHIPAVVSGFEPLDIIQAIYMILKQIKEDVAKIEIEYRRSVTFEGNRRAQETMFEVFRIADVPWRGLGVIPESGLLLKDKYSGFNAEEKFKIKLKPSREPAGCICGEILRGVKLPLDCKLFNKVCTPENPVGACMVSSEGACAAYFHYYNR